MSIEVEQIISDYLKANGYDGLVCEGEKCGCQLGDLAPCGEMRLDCAAAHKVQQPDGAEYDFMMYEGKKSDCHECNHGGHNAEEE